MEIESFFMEGLLDFSVPEEEEEKDEEDHRVRSLTSKKMARRKNVTRSTDSFGLIDPNDPELVEEEDLEWISNKDAFPVIETFVTVLPSYDLPLTSSEQAASKQLSPVSVLETSSNSSASITTTTTTTNSTGSCNGNTAVASPVGATAFMRRCGDFKVPVKARSKRPRTGRRNLCGLWTHVEKGPPRKRLSTAVVTLGRKCQHCGSEKTPQWRAGPLGPKTLCNACGVRFKSGRLVPEYRPANSPTFSAESHSNSHRKIIEMRKQRGGVTPSPATGKTVDKG